MESFNESGKALSELLEGKVSAAAVTAAIARGADVRAPVAGTVSVLVHYLWERRFLESPDAYVACLKQWDPSGASSVRIQEVLSRIRPGGVEVLSALLVNGADPNAFYNENIGSALHHAAVRFPDPREVKLLLEAGADVAARCGGGCTVLHEAVGGAWAGNPDVVSLLLRAGADPNAVDWEGSAPLHMAWQPHTIRLLLEAGAAVDARDSVGKTPLFSSNDCRSASAIRALVDGGADPKAVDQWGRTALHAAVLDGAPAEVVVALIGAGVDAHRRVSDGPQLGWSALDFCRVTPFYDKSEERTEVIAILTNALGN